jgi:hypothetical protein
MLPFARHTPGYRPSEGSCQEAGEFSVQCHVEIDQPQSIRGEASVARGSEPKKSRKNVE